MPFGCREVFFPAGRRQGVFRNLPEILNDKMNICFFTKHELTWGSSRERVGLYIDGLKDKGHKIKVISVIPNRLSRIWIGDKGSSRLLNRAYSFWHSRIIKNLKFVGLIVSAGKFDLIFIQKVNLAWSLVWLLMANNRNVIFDFDDLCFDLKKDTSSYALHPPRVLSLYKHIIAGNRRLAELATRAKGRENVTIIPTAIDCKAYLPKSSFGSNGPLVIGWAGSGENHLGNLRILVEPLRELNKKHDFIFKLIGAMGSKKIKDLFAFLESKLVVIDWLKISELPLAIKTFDIGVMPLEDNEQSRNKCGFKALQYMALGVPAVISPVGVNTEIISDGVNGFLAEDKQEWVDKLSRLIKNEHLRKQFSLRGRFTVEESYSCNSIFPRWMQALSSVKNN